MLGTSVLNKHRPESRGPCLLGRLDTSRSGPVISSRCIIFTRVFDLKPTSARCLTIQERSVTCMFWELAELHVTCNTYSLLRSNVCKCAPSRTYYNITLRSNTRLAEVDHDSRCIRLVDESYKAHTQQTWQSNATPRTNLHSNRRWSGTSLTLGKEATPSNRKYGKSSVGRHHHYANFYSIKKNILWDFLQRQFCWTLNIF